MASITTSPGLPSRQTYSCIRCANRKVKCDRQRPCSACVKHNVDCIFKPPPSSPQKRKRVSIQILKDRLRRYEALLQGRGIDLGKLPDTPETAPSPSISKTQVVHDRGRFKFVDNTLWTRVVEEFHESEDVLEDSSNDPNDSEVSDDDFYFVLAGQSKSTAKPRHPPPEHIHQLWQIFVENVDPVTKVVHVPTLRPAIYKAVSNLATIPRGFEALMFSIYGAAVMSLKDAECEQRFSEPRRTLLSRYINAAKLALSRAKFMGTSSLVVLQALVLHLLSVRDIYEPRAVWSLTGIAVRIAQGMGLERDGVSLGLPPFETEMRRRVWWLLRNHDNRTAELCGLAKFRLIDTSTDSDSTKWPTNVDDDKLYPGMPSLPVESDTLTDMIFVAWRDELAKFTTRRITMLRAQGKNSDQWGLRASGNNDQMEIDEAFRELEEIFETKYLRYCDPSQPLQLMTMLMGRFAMNCIRLLTHHPRRWASIEQTPSSEHRLVWETSIKLLEQHIMMHSNPQVKRFSWLSIYFQQWHAFIHVLDTLRANPLISNAERAWQAIGNIYESTPAMIYDTKKPIHVAVGNLCLKAWNDREAALQSENLCSPPTPEFILQLRQQREVAKARRKARDAEGWRGEHLVGHSHQDDNLESATHRQSTPTESPVIPQTGNATDDNSFWFNLGFNDSHLGDFDDVMNMDPESILGQDHIVGSSANQPINWEQLDAWLIDH